MFGWKDEHKYSRFIDYATTLAEAWCDGNDTWIGEVSPTGERYELSTMAEAKKWCEDVLIGYYEDRIIDIKDVQKERMGE